MICCVNEQAISGLATIILNKH